MLQGKHMPWQGAESKMSEAHEQARLAEVNACKATTALDSISEHQRMSEQSQARLAEVSAVHKFSLYLWFATTFCKFLDCIN